MPNSAPYRFYRCGLCLWQWMWLMVEVETINVVSRAGTANVVSPDHTQSRKDESLRRAARGRKAGARRPHPQSRTARPREPTVDKRQYELGAQCPVYGARPCTSHVLEL
jgi:hypothetical protein